MALIPTGIAVVAIKVILLFDHGVIKNGIIYPHMSQS